MSEAIESAIEAALKGGTSAAAPSRRAFPRYSASYPIFVEFDGSGHEPRTGVTVNVSRSGLLATFGEPVGPGTDCRVTFLPRDRYRPELIECPHCGGEFPTLEIPDEPIRGTVVRLERSEQGAFLAAILFEEPLGVLPQMDEGDAG